MKERYLLEDVGDNNGFSLITDYDAVQCPTDFDGRLSYAGFVP